MEPHFLPGFGANDLTLPFEKFLDYTYYCPLGFTVKGPQILGGERA
jgi:hypothetical protein